MSDRTHLTEPDEALRRARLDERTRTGLRLIADRFRNRRPHVLMTEAGRLAAALRNAEQITGGPGDAADELERELLMRMPYVDHQPITRGEYALILDRAAWGAR